MVTRDGWLKRLGEVKDPQHDAGSRRRRRPMDPARQHARQSGAPFSNFGVAYVMKLGNVPATTGYGEPVQSLLNFKDGERVIAAFSCPVPAPKKPRPKPRDKASSSSPRHPRARAGWSPRRGGMGFFCRPDSRETTKSGRRFARIKEGDELVVIVTRSRATPSPAPRRRQGAGAFRPRSCRALRPGPRRHPHARRQERPARRRRLPHLGDRLSPSAKTAPNGASTSPSRPTAPRRGESTWPA